MTPYTLRITVTPRRQPDGSVTYHAAAQYDDDEPADVWWAVEALAACEAERAAERECEEPRWFRRAMLRI